MDFTVLALDGNVLPLFRRLASELGIGVDVKLVEKKSIERSEGKAKRVIDLRKI